MDVGSTKKCDHEKKAAGDLYSIHTLMSWCFPTLGKFINLKWVKIPSSAALQVAKYMRTVK